MPSIQSYFSHYCIYIQRCVINTFLYPSVGFTYSNILTCLYILKTHKHPYVQSSKYLHTADHIVCFSSESSCSGTRWDSRRQEKYCFVFYWCFSKPGPGCSLFLAHTEPAAGPVPPAGRSPPYCFQYCGCVSRGSRTPGGRCCRNPEALTEFNKSRGLNRRSSLLPSEDSEHRGGQKRSWGPRWMMIGVAMVCGW